MSERITRIFGKNITYEYDVDCKKKEVDIADGDTWFEYVYTGRPCIKKEEKCDWTEIYSFAGEPYLIDKYEGIFRNQALNISEDEEVRVENKKFRADLNEIHLFVDKVVSENHSNKEDAEYSLKCELGSFNLQMIESNEKLKSYCNVHQLPIPDTDCIELFKIVYGHSNYKIVDGVMTERIKNDYCSTLTGKLSTHDDSISAIVDYVTVAGISSLKQGVE